MMKKTKIGLLPLYIELYDRALPEARPQMEKFYATIVEALGKYGLDVITAPVCRLEKEFRAAIKSFEDRGADGIVTLHLAYSPSLESADVLSSTMLPIVVLDTTPSYSFGPTDDSMELLFNHGIHGVQDMCNLLIRRGKRFHIEAGHWEKSDVLDRIAGWARAAQVATAIRNARVGMIGEAFSGMGDFAVPASVLRSTIGVEVVPSDPALISSLIPADDDIKAEIAANEKAFATEGLNPIVHQRTAQVSLAVRRWIEKENLSAFTMNFLAAGSASGLPVAPFLEASKAMARGIGYAGEGDALTAALVGALASVYPETTFTEMFCPDWGGETIFLSHMGEINLNLIAGKPKLIEKEFPWSDAENPAIAVGRLKAGKCVLVNLAPGKDDTFILIIAPVMMQDVRGEDRMAEMVHGWFRPRMPVAEFLEAYSRAGGTHHSALVYGDVECDLACFGEIMGWKVINLA